MVIFSRTVPVKTARRSEMIEVTGEVRALVEEAGVGRGKVTVFAPHTTAGVTVNEHADPAVAADILAHLEKMVPWDGRWRHGEGNAAAHVKASLVGSSATLPVEKGRLQLGTWQGVFFCEFDGPRTRKLRVTCEGIED